MGQRACLIGFDRTEAADIARRLSIESIASEMLPRIVVQDGQLLVEHPRAGELHPVSHVIFHGIFEDDLDFLSALALWNGPCFPNPLSLFDCRLRIACLARAVRYSSFANPPRGFVSAGRYISSEIEQVAKWSNWHCGENKARFSGEWRSDQNCLIEPFFPGEAVRVVLLRDRPWQIRMTGPDWLKSVHSPGAELMEPDPELVEDARVIRKGLSLDILANDYILTPDSKHLLEVNHIPSVTCFPELWEAYCDMITAWVQTQTSGGQ